MIGVFAQTLAAAVATTANCQSQHWQQGCTLGVSGGGKRGLAYQPESDCQRGVKTICAGPSNVDIEIDAVDGGDQLAILNIVQMS